MRLYLVRHGRTPSNVARLLDTAVPGADLDVVGREQAAALVDRLAGVPLDAIYASDLVRTQQTAGPLASARGLAVTVLGGLREIQAGDDEMSPSWDRYVASLKAWGEGELAAGVPGGEDAATFFGRYDAAVAEIAGAGHASALLVSHGAALRMWIGARVRGVDVAEVVGRRLGNTTIVTLDRGDDGAWDFVDWEEIEEPDEWPASPTPEPGAIELSAAEASAAAPGWRVLRHRLHLTTDWSSFADAAGFVAGVAELADAAGHHPAIDVRDRRVHLAVTTHEVGGVTPRDVDLANRISVLVHERGGVPAPGALAEVGVVLDTPDADAIAGFWAAVLGHERGDDALVDPDRIGPSVWFADPRVPAARGVRLDVTVAHDAAEARVADALAAGGRLVSDAHAPASWLLADADGNEARVSTWRDVEPDEGV